jgi:hypothetical protein
MANGGHKDSEIEGARAAVKTPEKPSENKPALSPELEKIQAGKREAKEVTAEKTAELKRERLENEIVGPDKDTAGKILSIEVTRESAEQREELDRLELVSYTLLAKLFAAGFKKEILQVFESLRSIQVDESVPLNATEKIALKKLGEIAGHPLTPLFATENKKWSETIERAHKTYEAAESARKAMLGPEEKAEKQNPIVEFVKEHPVPSAMIAAAGAYGVYKIFFEEDEESNAGTGDNGNKKESFWKSAKKPAGIGLGLGLLVLGEIIGPERIKDWLQTAFNFSKEKVERFVKLLTDGEYKAAFFSLFEGNDENIGNYGKIAETIGKETGKKVTDSAIKRIADAKYGMFMAVSGEVKSFAANALKNIPGIGSIASYLVESDEQIAEEKTVREYLEKHKADIEKIKPDANATVFQILAELNGLEVKGPQIEKEKEPGTVSEAIQTGLGETVGVIEETMADIKAEFKDKPNFAKLMEKYDKGWSGIFFHPIDFMNELFSACKKDKVQILIGGGQVILVNGLKFITFTSAKSLFNAATTLVEAPFSDEIGWSDGISEYLIGTSPFILIGGTVGFLNNIGNKPLMGLVKGAGRGAILPIDVARMSVKGTQWAYRSARGASYEIRRHLSEEEVKPKIFEDEARFYADVFDEYDRLETEGEQGKLISPKKWYAKLTSERIANLKLEYLKKFAAVYKQIEGGTELFTKTDSEKAASTTKLREWIREQRAAGKIKPPKGEPKMSTEAKTEIETKMMTPEVVEGKPNVYRFAGQEFVIAPEEITARNADGISNPEAIKAICMEKALSHLTVEEVRIKGDVYEYKIGGQWIKTENPTEPAKIAEIKTQYEAIMKQEGKPMDFARFAAEAKTLKYFGVLEKVMGTAAAIGVIVHLETAADKRKAIAEVAGGFGTFYAGMKLTDWQIGGKFKNPGVRTVIDIAGGLATALGFTEPVSDLISSFYKDKPWAYGASNEVKDIMEKMSYLTLSRTVFASAEKGLLKKGLGKIGLEAVERAFEKEVGSIFLKKISQLAAMQGFKQILKALGLRGATTVALLADDATVIGVVDDIVAAGLMVWMGYDAIQLVRLVANANEVNNQMTERAKHKISAFEIKDPKSRAALQEKLTPFGLTVDKAAELGERQLFDILRTMPQTIVEIERQGTKGKEVWTLNKGEAVGIAILDDGGKAVAQIADEDAIKMSEALANVQENAGGEMKEAA